MNCGSNYVVMMSYYCDKMGRGRTIGDEIFWNERHFKISILFLFAREYFPLDKQVGIRSVVEWQQGAIPAIGESERGGWTMPMS